ncbi:hypothetical protein KM043_004311 [Ampulex compressa]|nr:hypothetical protein KM043_004311 [Ampulex compressa]
MGSVWTGGCVLTRPGFSIDESTNAADSGFCWEERRARRRTPWRLHHRWVAVSSRRGHAPHVSSSRPERARSPSGGSSRRDAAFPGEDRRAARIHGAPDEGCAPPSSRWQTSRPRRSAPSTAQLPTAPPSRPQDHSPRTVSFDPLDPPKVRYARKAWLATVRPECPWQSLWRIDRGKRAIKRGSFVPGTRGRLVR